MGDFKKLFLVQIISTNGKIRSSNLVSELNNQKIEFILSPGFTPSLNEFSAEKLHNAKISKLITRRDLKIGEVGCAIAHQQTAKNLTNSVFKFALVFEDDAEIKHKIDFQLLNTCLDTNIPRIVILGWIPGHAVALKNSESTINGVSKLATPSTCTFAYALNKPAAELIKNKNKKILDLADWPIHTFDVLEFYSVDSMWVDADHEPENSTIGVRAPEVSKNFLTKIKNQFLLLISIIKLFITFKTSGTEITLRQIFHRMIIRDQILNWGSKRINKLSADQSKNSVIFLDNKLTKLLGIF